MSQQHSILVSKAAVVTALLLGKISNFEGSRNRLQQQQICSMCFTALSMLTWKRQIVCLVVESVFLGENAIYDSFLKQKVSSKATGLIGTLLSNGSTGLLSVKGGVDRRGQRRAFWGRINLFVEAFGVELFPFGGALAISYGQCGECSSLFRGSSSTSMVDIYGCLGARSLGSPFDDGFREKRLRSWQEGGKFLLETGFLAGNSFIFGNNNVAESLKHCRKCHILQQKKPFSTFVDARCIFSSIDEVER